MVGCIFFGINNGSAEGSACFAGANIVIIFDLRIKARPKNAFFRLNHNEKAHFRAFLR